MTARSLIPALTAVATIALTTGFTGFTGSTDGVPLHAADPSTSTTPRQLHHKATAAPSATGTPAAPTTSPPSTQQPTPERSGALRTQPTLCQPDGPHGKTVRLVVPVGWNERTREQGCDWTSPDGMGSVSVFAVGEERATFSAVQDAAKGAPGFVAGYHKVALYGDVSPSLGEVVVWEHLGEDVYTFHFAAYYAVGWQATLMLPESSWDSTGAATFAQIRHDFTPLP